MTDQTATGGGSVGEVVNPQDMVNVQHCSRPQVADHCYRMEARPRGYCLIFNVFEFSNTSYDIRRGSQVEAQRLSEVFDQLYFDCKVYDNPTKKTIEDTVEEYARSPELSRHDAIVVIVLSHGLSGGFICSEGGFVDFKNIVDKLNNQNCRQLINKPKLFFFSCCRGDNKDFGTEHTIQALDNLQINAIADTITFSNAGDSLTAAKVKVPVASDIMICYSTVDGYVSWRCEEKGTWLGYELCQVLLRHSHDKDLLTMLTTISSKIENRVFTEREAKQVIEVILRGFKKSFYFNPGHPSPLTVTVVNDTSPANPSPLTGTVEGDTSPAHDCHYCNCN